MIASKQIRGKRLPFYVAGGAGLSALAATLGLTLTNSGSNASAVSAAPATTVVQTRNSSLGSILVDSQGRTLYLFAQDTGSRSSCTGSCASVWPPVPVAGTPQVSGAASASAAGVTAGTGGVRQLTYAGHPLYYFAGDGSAGQTRGQGVDEFGAKWYVLNPAGQAITGAGPKPGSTQNRGYGY
jgi:predicted lipoprotein with Yx(FWY)xxD motif